MRTVNAVLKELLAASPDGVLDACEYLRVSLDRSGKKKSNDQQHQDAVETDWLPGLRFPFEPYADAKPASRQAKRAGRARRPDGGWAKLLADLRSGRFPARILVCWELSRMVRDVADVVELLALCEERGVLIAITMDGKFYCPANHGDRKLIIDKATQAEHEAGVIQDRVERDASAGARNGLPHGGVPFGYRRVFDPSTGRLGVIDRKTGAVVSQIAEPTEARVVVELFERLNAGDPLAAIAKDFAARRITSRKGVPFAPQTLRGMALAPVYAGRRVHQPGHASRAHRGVEAPTTPGTWERLVPDDVFYAVRLRLTDPSRRTVRPGRGIHLLSMLARCDVCGAKLTVTYRKGPRAYQCHGRGCVKVDADDLDAWAEEQIEGWFAHPDGPEHLYRDDDRGELLTAARGVVERTRAEHADLTAQVATGALSATLAAGAEPAILARLAEAETAVFELMTPDGLDGLIRAGADVVEQWKAMAMPVRREIVRLLFSPARAGVLSVARVTDSAEVDARVRLDGKPLRVA